MSFNNEKFVFDKPKISEIKELDNNCFEVLIDPLKKNLSYIFGNAIRRILLSSLPGLAITEVYIENCLHEYDTINYLRQDIIEILLNLKKTAILFNNDVEEINLSVIKTGPSILYAKDLVKDSILEVSNPNHIIADIYKEGTIKLFLKIIKGRGLNSNNNMNENIKIGTMHLDASFNPIIGISFVVIEQENKKFDQLKFFIKTKGNVNLNDAINTAMIYLYEQIDVFVNLKTPVNRQIKKEINKIDNLLKKNIEELELTVRSANCLKHQNINFLRDIVQLHDSDLMKIPNLGKKSLNEIKAILTKMGLSLGMILENKKS